MVAQVEALIVCMHAGVYISYMTHFLSASNSAGVYLYYVHHL